MAKPGPRGPIWRKLAANICKKTENSVIIAMYRENYAKWPPCAMTLRAKLLTDVASARYLAFITAE
ncbi:hypothetical protein [Novosphingobium sp. PASSN1]|uniref:hypothetical protein n=1 Tax=Novosphingobium sp. PASSN1 TaxID=2015561 RepID=UPI0025FF533D|nr:hypothetical protein [Novosphingobium sp. PASSN1]